MVMKSLPNTMTTLAESYGSSVARSLNSPAALIHESFLWHAFASPERPCLEFNGITTTYGEVERRSASAAHGLIELGIKPGQIVAIIAERCDSLIWTLLGVLRAGAAFVVIDKAYPCKRIESLLALADPALVVTCSLTPREDLKYPIPAPVFDHAQLRAFGASSTGEVNCRVSSENLAYYLFTSGSTGKPKCVACNHAPLVNFVGWHVETFNLTGDDRFSMLSGLSHDPVLRDIFTPLSLGAALVIPHQKTITEIGGARQFLWEQRISVVHLTPPLGQLILSGRANAPLLTDVRHFFWGGDKLRAGIISAMRKVAPRAEHTNFYGCTETPQAATFYRCPPILPEEGIPIGQGISEFEIRIVDSAHNPVADGRVGEIAIVSRFLSLGYIEQGRIVNPSSRDNAIPGGRIYCTGDIGRVLPDGDVLVIGRSDDQIKIRGYRLDLSEITTLLSRHPQVASAIALAIGPEDNRKVGAFVSPRSGMVITEKDLAAYAAASLPSYMVPAEIFFLPDGLPLLPNGKVDRATLIEEASNRSLSKRRDSAEAISDSTLGKLIKEWADLFHRNDIDAGSTFNSLGGDSLTYVGAYLVAEEILGTVPDDWQTMPLGKLAEVGKKKNRFIASVDSVIALRAISMILIVSVHAYQFAIGRGATTALFVVSGYLYAKSMNDALFDSSRCRKLLLPLRNLFLPTAIFAIFGATVVLVKHHYFFPASFLLMADSIPQPGVHEYFHAFSVWYLEALIKIIIATFCLQALVARYKPGPGQQFRFLAFVASALCIFRLSMPQLTHMMFPSFHSLDVDPVVSNYNFISNMGPFYVGILLPRLITNRLKIQFLFAGVIYALLCIHDLGLWSSFYFIASVFLILYVPRICIPRLISNAVYEIASCSMYIYLSHWYLIRFWEWIMQSLGAPAIWFHWIYLPLGILGGIAVTRTVRFFQYGNNIWLHRARLPREALEEG